MKVCTLFLIFFLLFHDAQSQNIVSSTAVTPENCGSVKFTDARDGKVYNSVKIGLQCWMAEDLRFGLCDANTFSTHQKSSIKDLIEMGYWGVCIAGSSPEGGNLYNWQAAMNSADAAYGTNGNPARNFSGGEATEWKGICPEGWHLPSGGKTGEFYTLRESIKGTSESSLCKDESEFKGQLAGFGFKTEVHNPGKFGYHWSSTPYSPLYSYSLFFDTTSINPEYYAGAKAAGLTVRCLKNEISSSGELIAGTLTDLGTICNNSTINLSGTPATEDGVVISTYEWSVNIDNIGFTVIPDETKDVLKYSTSEVGNSYVFRRKALGARGSAFVEVSTTVLQSVGITAQPKSQNTVCQLKLAITVSGTAPLKYQWYKNLTKVSNATQSSLTSSTTSASDNGHYYCVVSNECGDFSTDTVQVTVATPGAITTMTDPRDGTVYKTRVMEDGREWMIEDLKFGTCNKSDFSMYVDSDVKDKIASGVYGVCVASTTAGVGHFYNWQAAMNHVDADHSREVRKNPSGNIGTVVSTQWQGICPDGWHLPSGTNNDGEFSVLRSSSCRLSNATGWNGSRGGHHSGSELRSSGQCAYYWSSCTPNTTPGNVASYLFVSNYDFEPYPGISSYDGRQGLNVRCVKNY